MSSKMKTATKKQFSEILVEIKEQFGNLKEEIRLSKNQKQYFQKRLAAKEKAIDGLEKKNGILDKQIKDRSKQNKKLQEQIDQMKKEKKKSAASSNYRLIKQQFLEVTPTVLAQCCLVLCALIKIKIRQIQIKYLRNTKNLTYKQVEMEKCPQQKILKAQLLANFNIHRQYIHTQQDLIKIIKKHHTNMIGIMYTHQKQSKKTFNIGLENYDSKYN